MPAILRLKPEEIDTNAKRGKYTVSVVGCRQLGILYVTAFAEAGYKVICTDADQSLLKNLAKGKTIFAEREAVSKLKRFLRKGQLRITSDLKSAVSQSDIIILTLAAKIDGEKSPDYSEAEKSCKQIGAALHRDTLIIYAGISGLGSTEGVIKETLENSSGLRVEEDFGLVYNPIHISNVQTTAISNQKLKVAAMDKTSVDIASAVLGTITEKGVQKIFGLKIAEAAALFEVTKRDANLALANELAIFCENADLDYLEVLKFVDLELQEKNFSPKIAEEDSRNGAYLLLESAENLNTKLRLPTLARHINERIVGHAVNLTQDALRSCGKTVRRARVALFGSVKPNTAAAMFVKMLEKKGAKISLYDPSLSKNEMIDMAHVLRRRSLNEAAEGKDCMVILSEQKQFKRINLKKLRAVMKTPSAIVDLTGIIEPQKVEKEGFIYRGLGRGAVNK